MTHIIFFENQLLCFYYDYDNNNIMLKKYLDKNNTWSTPSVIFNNALDTYTINIYFNQINLFCQNRFGHAFLCSYKNNNWQSKIILQSQFNYDLKIYPMININNLNQDFYLLYNIPADKNNFYLVINQLKNNRWQPLAQIDKIYSLKNFCVQNINNNYLIAFYIKLKKSNEINLGYREINSSKQSDFNIIHSTYYKITDTSFLVTNNSIHSLFTIKNLFTKQLIYKKKQGDYFSKPIILFDSPNINNNLLLIIKNNLYACWTINNKIYFCISKDNGLNFSKPQVFMSNTFELEKAIFLSDKNLDLNKNLEQQDFFCREVYINKNNPWEIKFLFDLDPDIKKNLFSLDHKYKNQNQNNIYQQDLAQKQEFNINSLNTQEIINKLKNQLEIKNKQLIQKDKQILELTNLLKSKNDEIIALCVTKKNKKSGIDSDPINQNALNNNSFDKNHEKDNLDQKNIIKAKHEKKST